MKRGFTILEVMIALALLALALTVLIKSAAGSIFNAQQAHMMGVSTDIARAKMYEIEETLLKDGYSDTEQQEDWKPCFEDNQPEILCATDVIEVELPDWDNLQAMAQGRAAPGAGSGSGKLGSGAWAPTPEEIAAYGSAYGSGFGSGSGGPLDSFQNSALGGMMAQLGGGIGGGKSAGSGAGSDVDSQMGSSFIQSQYQMFQQILKVSVRKVTLKVKWKVLGSDREMTVVAFYTDGAAMDKVISGLGSTDLPDTGSGSGSGSGSSTKGTTSTGTKGTTSK